MLVREFGNYQTGLVTNTSFGAVTVVGGKVSLLGGVVLTGASGNFLYYHG